MPDIREPETALEKCEVEIQNQPDKTECRLVVKMICRHGVYLFFMWRLSLTIGSCQGVIKTYRLTYESVEVMNALFNKDATKSKWTISATVLRSFIEYFGATTEQLDIYSENGRATFTSYTDKVINGKG